MVPRCSPEQESAGYQSATHPRAAYEEITAISRENLLVAIRFSFGDHFTNGHPAETVHRDEVEPDRADLLYAGKV